MYCSVSGYDSTSNQPSIPQRPALCNLWMLSKFPCYVPVKNRQLYWKSLIKSRPYSLKGAVDGIVRMPWSEYTNSYVCGWRPAIWLQYSYAEHRPSPYYFVLCGHRETVVFLCQRFPDMPHAAVQCVVVGANSGARRDAWTWLGAFQRTWWMNDGVCWHGWRGSARNGTLSEDMDGWLGMKMVEGLCVGNKGVSIYAFWNKWWSDGIPNFHTKIELYLRFFLKKNEVHIHVEIALLIDDHSCGTCRISNNCRVSRMLE